MPSLMFFLNYCVLLKYHDGNRSAVSYSLGAELKDSIAVFCSRYALVTSEDYHLALLNLIL
uniref:Uncharacterized protein n=1 Tax=Lotus japonicus TaxID=34305 RepID=I3SR11_LOTJA|nr:unknown [Lotus japonicus]